ncbi:hypothetical protein ACQVTX_23320 [Bacillus pretiosus]|uniref:beta barrel domain-containing protein n=1 Tax=Bacillus pretiosus TaxID=2983392 RepID=UPI003D653034
MTKPKVGQKVYLEACGNQARWYGREVRKWEVKKVGRKYFFVGSPRDDREIFWLKFYIEDLRQATDLSTEWILFFSEQEVLDKNEYNTIISELSDLFRHANFYSHRNKVSIEQLRKIKDVLNS